MSAEQRKKNMDNNKDVLDLLKPDMGYEHGCIMELLCEMFNFCEEDFDFNLNYFTVYSIPRIDILEDDPNNYTTSITSTYNPEFGWFDFFRKSNSEMLEGYIELIRVVLESANRGSAESKFRLFMSVWPNYCTHLDSEIKVRSINSHLGYLKNSGLTVSPDIENTKALLSYEIEDDNYNPEVDLIAKDYSASLNYLLSVCDDNIMKTHVRDGSFGGAVVNDTLRETFRKKAKECEELFISTTMFNNIFRGLKRTEYLFDMASEHQKVYHKFMNFTSLLSLFGVEFNTYSKYPGLFNDRAIIENGCAKEPFFKKRSSPTYIEGGYFAINEEKATLLNSIMIDALSTYHISESFKLKVPIVGELDLTNISDPNIFLYYVNEVKAKILDGSIEERELEMAEKVIGDYAIVFNSIFNDPQMNAHSLTTEDSACILLKNTQRYTVNQLVNSAIASGKFKAEDIKDQQDFNRISFIMFEIDFCTHVYRLGMLLKIFFNTEISGLDFTYFSDADRKVFDAKEKEGNILGFLQKGYEAIEAKYTANPDIPKPYGNMKPFSFRLKIIGSGNFIRLVDLPARFTDDGISSLYSDYNTPDTEEDDIPFYSKTNFYLHVLKSVESIVRLDLLANKEVDYANLKNVYSNAESYSEYMSQNGIVDSFKESTDNEDLIDMIDRLNVVFIDERPIMADLFFGFPNARSLMYYTQPKASAKQMNDERQLNGYIDKDTDIEAIQEIVDIMTDKNGDLTILLGVDTVNHIRGEVVDVVDSRKYLFDVGLTPKGQRKPD